MLEYCDDNDGYSMQQMDSYHSTQMQDDYHHSPHAGMSMKPPPPPQYSKPNMMMYNGNYTSHQDGFPGKNNYSNAYYGQPMHQSGYSGSSGGTHGYYMSHGVMGGKPPYHDTMNASHFTQGGGSGGGYNPMMMSSSSDHQYDYNYNNKIRRPPNRMQGAVMGYDNGNWGNPTTGYSHHSSQIVNCMPYGYNTNDEWLTKSLA